MASKGVRHTGTKRWTAVGLAGLLLALLSAAAAEARCVQPVYVIAHRCNGNAVTGRVWVPQVVGAQGVNAIEADFLYSKDNHGWFLAHDVVTVNSMGLQSWLAGVYDTLHSKDSPLALIILDIKTPDGPLINLYNEVRGKLGPDVNLIFTIGNYSARGEFAQLAAAINGDPRAGAAIDLLYSSKDEDQFKVRDYFKGGTTQIGPVSFPWPAIPKYWYADGWNAGASPASVDTNVNTGMALRETECNAFHGVYTWTYEKEGSIKELLTRDYNGGVNGILVNAEECFGYAAAGAWSPGEAVAFAKTLPWRKFATPADNPFTLGPQITCPPETTVECSQAGGASPEDLAIRAFLAGAQAGNCDAVSITHNEPSPFALNTTQVVTFTATDSTDFREFGICRRSAACEAKITVKDSTAPKLLVPDDQEHDPESPQGTPVTFSATASDVCDSGPQVVCNPPSGTTFAVGTETKVACTATDTAGNRSTGEFRIKVFSPAEVVGHLQAWVGLAPGLSHGEATSLSSQLSVALRAIGERKIPTACGHLENFVQKINKAIEKGNLKASEGQQILGSVTKLHKTLACLKPL